MANSPDKVLGIVPGQPMQSYGSSGAPADTEYAEVDKDTTVRPGVREGTPVAPWNANGGMVPNRFPPGERQWWTVESGTHA